MALDAEFLKELQNFSYELCRLAAEIALEAYEKPTPADLKNDRSPVTEIDRRIEKQLCKKIADSYPEHQIYGEEFGVSGPTHSSFKWWIDPIDGTLSFIRKIPAWGPVIGCEYQGRVIAGGFGVPASNVIYTAAEGEGCYRNQKERLKLKGPSYLSEASLHFGGLPNTSEAFQKKAVSLTQKAFDWRAWGDVFSYSLLLDGKIDAVVDLIAEAYDLSAIQICISEAGGVFSSLNGLESIQKKHALAASSKELHQDIVKEFL